jgi:hypothetical protein
MSNTKQQTKRGDALLTRRNKAAMIAALHKSLGIVSSAAKKVGIDRVTHYRWMERDEEYKAQVEAIEDEVLDFAESKLFTNVDKGHEASIFFLLKCKGNKRCYVERQEIEHSSGESTGFKFVLHGQKGEDS